VHGEIHRRVTKTNVVIINISPGIFLRKLLPPLLLLPDIAVFAEIMTDDLSFGLFLSVPPLCGGRGGGVWKLEERRGYEEQNGKCQEGDGLRKRGTGRRMGRKLEKKREGDGRRVGVRKGTG
jgi:hypothetical protein